MEPGEGIVYGPVRSRRLGRSLGVDLTPRGCLICNFDCAYCEPGQPVDARCAPHWPTPGEVGSALRNAFFQVGPLDSITIAGRGEPTLHPHFPAVVAEVLAESRRARPEVPVRILSNGSRTTNPVVRRALDLLDERIVTLDAAAERVDRPGARLPLGARIQAFCMLRDFTVQACFVDGTVGNVDERSVGEWVELLAELRPRAVQVYTIDRPPRAPGVRPASSRQLEAISRRLHDETGIPVQLSA
jgi:wyosine [tRNA(Phe)-imidazoG37] synthetase (radical SAM superfamily)